MNDQYSTSSTDSTGKGPESERTTLFPSVCYPKPVQITKSTAAGFMRTQPDLFKGQEDYVKQYVKQGQSMLGNVKAGDACGPGGCGSLSDEKYHKPYQQMASGVMRGKMRELKIDDTKEMSAQDRERFIQSWRGVSRQQDPKYYAAIDAAYKAN